MQNFPILQIQVFDKDKKLAASASERVLSALEKMNDQRHGKDTEGYDKMAAVLADAVNGANSIDIITESQRMVLPQTDLSKDPAEFDAKNHRHLMHALVPMEVSW